MKSKNSALKEKFGIEIKDVKKATLFIRAIDNKLRWKILELLAEKGELTVTELIEILKKEQSAISSYLAILRKEGFVQFRREHKNVFYSIKQSGFQAIGKTISVINDYKEREEGTHHYINS
jgi:DNA-binding transcriptional ArsR family regulator